MCTAISLFDKDHYFGRTLDLERGYGEEVVITPRNYPLRFRACSEALNHHYAIIGTAAIVDGYPLYFEAANERGLCVAGLNFVRETYYHSKKEGYFNIESFELIPWILSQCSCAGEAEELLLKTNILGDSFDERLGLARLHWIVADGRKTITVESVREGIKLYDNPIGVLTNSPDFSYHMLNLSNYASQSPYPPKSSFGIELKPYSRGMGAVGLPGDCSSASRFVRAAFNKLNSVAKDSEESKVSRFFHILGSVEQIEGTVRLERGELVKTVYTSCINATQGIFYYTTYENRRICAVDMRDADLDRHLPIRYSMRSREDILFKRS